MELFELINEIKSKLQDLVEDISRSDLETTAITALAQFSKDRPRRQVFDITGDGGYDYDLPSDWIPGFSQIKCVEYPAGDRIPLYLEDGDWGIYETTSTRKLRLLNHTPSAAETVRIGYTTVYLKSTVDQIEAHETDAFANLAASLCCGVLARRYGFTTDPTISADAVNYGGKGGEWARRAKELRALYNKFITGSESGKPAASSCTGDWDTRPSWGGDHLLHPRKGR